MTGRSLNRVELIGNLTRDPELQQTTKGISVCNFSIATDRTWKNDAGETLQETEYHRIIAWHKLGEVCGAYLQKGSRVYIDGRLANRKYTGSDGIERTTTEIIANDVIMLSNPKPKETVDSIVG